MGTPVGRMPSIDPSRALQRWALYDEKYVLSGKGLYDGKSPQVWLQSIHHYMAGRTEDMDRVLTWVEKQQSVIPRDPSGCTALPAIDLDYREVSRQLWAFFGPLVSGNPVVNGVFENVDRHNGLGLAQDRRTDQ